MLAGADDSGQMPTRPVRALDPPAVLVYGAYGHTGRFVVAELERRGLGVVLAGRSAAKLEGMRSAHPGLEQRCVDVAEATALDRALDGVSAVINCAGPFLDTALPIASAAIRSGIGYLDIAAEQPSTARLFDHLDEPARSAGVTVLPAMAYFGALGDLLVAAALGNWTEADSVEVVTLLAGWEPTVGTLETGRRNPEPYSEVSAGRLVPENTSWTAVRDFPSPFGTQELIILSLAETILIHHHVGAPEVRACINRSAVDDLTDSGGTRRHTGSTAVPAEQAFILEAAVTRNGITRGVRARGNDIYAISAPIVVAGTVRLLAGLPSGVHAVGAVVDPVELLRELPLDLETITNP